MSILPVSNVINVTITNTPQGLTEKNVNSLALFTNEATASLNPYDVYVSASDVASDYGTASLTAQMASEIFSQVPNIRTGNGRLVIVPMLNAVSATPGSFTSANLSANLSSIIAVTNGDLRITINGTSYDLTGLNFTKCLTWSDIAQYIQNRLPVATISAITNGISVTSKKVGTSSTIAIAAVPSGTGTALNGTGFFNAVGGTTATGTNSAGETLLAAIARTDGAVGYVPMLTTLSLEDSAILTIANAVQAMDKMFHYASGSLQDIAGISTTITQAKLTKTRFKAHSQGVVAGKLYNAAYAGRGHSVNFNGSRTSQTMNLKSLAGISPDTGVSQTDYAAAEIAGCDLYVSYDGVSSVVSTGGNEYFDNVYSDLAIKFSLETAGFNYLRGTNTKVPQTEEGMNGLKNAYAQVFERYVGNGVIAPGTWQSSETFGDPIIFTNNIESSGYYTYSLPIARQNQTERLARKAPLVQSAFKRAGAIHSGDVLVLVNA